MSLSQAIFNQYGQKEGLMTVDGVITQWPYSTTKPGKTALKTLALAGEKIILTREIKKMAHARIVSSIPEWKQRNLLARAVELSNKKHAESLTESEQLEEQGIAAQWAKVRAIRSYSDALEVQVSASATPSSVDITDGWPE